MGLRVGLVGQSGGGMHWRITCAFASPLRWAQVLMNLVLKSDLEVKGTTTLRNTATIYAPNGKVRLSMWGCRRMRWAAWAQLHSRAALQ